jgi:protein-S-isoprenylcysteine O-methyltransferase Ste14
MASKGLKFVQRFRVFAGFIFSVVFLVFARPTWLTLIVGVSIALIGLGLRAWACGHIQKVRELDTSGPYSYTRNPLYLGTSIIALGFGIASGVWWLALLAFVFYVSIYFPVMNVEAEELASWLGETYRDSAAGVPLFFPRLTPWKNPLQKSVRHFDFQLYLKHREYNAALGTLFVSGVLAAKILIFTQI